MTPEQMKAAMAAAARGGKKKKKKPMYDHPDSMKTSGGMMK